MMILPGHRAQSPNMPVKPLEYFVLAAQIFGHKLAGLLSEVFKNRPALEDCQRSAAARGVVIDNRRHSVIRADLEEFRSELLAGSDVHVLNFVGEATLLEH